VKHYADEDNDGMLSPPLRVVGRQQQGLRALSIETNKDFLARGLLSHRNLETMPSASQEGNVVRIICRPIKIDCDGTPLNSSLRLMCVAL
jgi:hypothetical protein